MPPDLMQTDYPHATWRLVDSGHLNGADNMAVDEAILEAVAAGDSLPTLRFYGWQPPAVSLGYRQPLDVLDLERCAQNGWDVVRRPTGGRAILHIDELTYSVCAPVNEPRVHGSVLESYRRLSQALLAGLQEMGLRPVQAASSGMGDSSGPACFDSPSDYEITVLGRKLIGSAQVRKYQTVLQHGTLPLFGDVGRLADALKFGDLAERQALGAALRDKAATLEVALGRCLSLAEAATFMARGFAEKLNLTLQPAELSPAELARARELKAEKYAAAAWQERISHR